MILVLAHVTLALSSVALSAYTLARPSKQRLYTSYGLVTATFASGTYLVISTHSNLVSACLTGLLYLGFLLSALAVAHRRIVNTDD